MSRDSRHDEPDLPEETDLRPGGPQLVEPKAGPDPLRPLLVQFPGLALICLYLLALAMVIIAGVVGHHYPALFLVFAAGSVTASGGLLRLFRWAWALALSAVLLLVIYNLWVFSSFHQGAALVQGMFNLVFFLYLVRPEIRERLK
jgi:glycerol-3-phosphate acyltransferase PlsY